MQSNTPAFGPLVEECAKHGISRSVAYELVASGLLASFKIGARRYVLTDSLRELPEKLARPAGGKAVAE
jgi:hypothetical protein